MATDVLFGIFELVDFREELELATDVEEAFRALDGFELVEDFREALQLSTDTEEALLVPMELVDPASEDRLLFKMCLLVFIALSLLVLCKMLVEFSIAMLCPDEECLELLFTGIVTDEAFGDRLVWIPVACVLVAFFANLTY